ncbi:hypothetical protein D3C76_1208030 [compost metagenome]
MAGVVADGSGAGFVFADGQQGAAKGRTNHPQRAGEDQQEQHGDEHIEVSRIGQVDQYPTGDLDVRPGHVEQAVVTSGPAAQGVGQEVGHLAEGQGQHDEVDAFAADGQGAYQQRQERAEQRCTEQ